MPPRAKLWCTGGLKNLRMGSLSFCIYRFLGAVRNWKQPFIHYGKVEVPCTPLLLGQTALQPYSVCAHFLVVVSCPLLMAHFPASTQGCTHLSHHFPSQRGSLHSPGFYPSEKNPSTELLSVIISFSSPSLASNSAVWRGLRCTHHPVPIPSTEIS